ncbi:MAG: ATPase, T2SS/T4P/T4SS family, partial [Pseudohongiellaceae bacterium]
MTTEATITGLARRLVSDHLLQRDAATAACTSADKDGTTLIRHLVKNCLVDSRAIASAAAQEFGLPLFDLSVFDPANLPGNVIAPKLMRKYNVLPLQRKGNRLFLGVSDPSDPNLVSEIKFHTGLSIDLVVLEDDKLDAIIDKLLRADAKEESNFSSLEGMGLEDIEIGIVEEKLVPEDEGNLQDEAPIVRFVNKILCDAIKQGASDIHIEPYEKVYRVRFRQDGILREIARPPLNIANRISSRIKIMSSMDISERRIPQDGRIKLKLSRTRAVDLRVNTLPTLWGEKIVLRILDPGSTRLGIDVLGYEPAQKQQYLNALHQQQGLILVTGPTGSGKTVSLYSGLNILNTGARNISTVEDPVEINLE